MTEEVALPVPAEYVVVAEDAEDGAYGVIVSNRPRSRAERRRAAREAAHGGPSRALVLSTPCQRCGRNLHVKREKATEPWPTKNLRCRPCFIQALARDGKIEGGVTVAG